MKIKKIEDLKKCQIVCRNQEQVKDCLNYLEQLGFNVFHFRFDYCCIIFYEINLFSFCVSDTIHSDLIIEYYNKEFIKTLQKFIKEKEEQKREKKEKVEDFEVASDGRITKINNYKSKEKVFIACQKKYIGQTVWDTIDDFNPEFLDYLLKYGLAFSTKEARDKAMFKLEIETKLKNIAERLNKGQKIDWEDIDQDKFRIYYNFKDKILDWDTRYCRKDQGIIYCLDKNFLDVAKKEIGEENLIKYFKE